MSELTAGLTTLREEDIAKHLAVAQGLVTRVVVLDQGELIEEGPPDQIFSAPSHPRTRAFLSRVLPEITAC